MFVLGRRVRIGTLTPMAFVVVPLTAAVPPTVFIAVTLTAFFAPFGAVEPLLLMAPAGSGTSIPMALRAIPLAVPGPSGCCRPAKLFDGRPIMALVQSFAFAGFLKRRRVCSPMRVSIGL